MKQAFFGTHRAYREYLRAVNLRPRDVIFVVGTESVQGQGERLEIIVSGSPWSGRSGNRRWEAVDYIRRINHNQFPKEEENA